MHLTLLTDGIYPHQVGGMQKHSFYLAEFLARMGVRIALYHLGGEQETPFSDEARMRITEHVVPFPAAGKLPGHYIRNSRAHAQAVARAVAQHPPTDFIYAQGYTAWEILRQKEEGKSWPPVCVNFHGMEALQPAASRRNWLEQRMLAPPMRRQLRQADFVQSLGGKLTDLLIQTGVSPARIWEIPIGLDESWVEDPLTPSNHRARQFVFLGRYERRKGVEELNAALQRWVPEAPFTFHFIGPIPDALQLSGSTFQYHGLIRDPQQIKGLLQEADVLVSPSHAEGMPTVILEAMASGCAIIATDVGAVAEEVDPEVGWLIPPKSEKALESALQEALGLSNDALLAKKQAARQKVIDRFLWPQVAAQTLSHIKKSLSALPSK